MGIMKVRVKNSAQWLVVSRQGDNKDTAVGFERMMTFEAERLRCEGRR